MLVLLYSILSAHPLEKKERRNGKKEWSSLLFSCYHSATTSFDFLRRRGRKKEKTRVRSKKEEGEAEVKSKEEGEADEGGERTDRREEGKLNSKTRIKRFGWIGWVKKDGPVLLGLKNMVVADSILKKIKFFKKN